MGRCIGAAFMEAGSCVSRAALGATGAQALDGGRRRLWGLSFSLQPQSRACRDARKAGPQAALSGAAGGAASEQADAGKAAPEQGERHGFGNVADRRVQAQPRVVSRRDGDHLGQRERAIGDGGR